MEDIKKELLELAMKAKSSQEIKELAKENGYDIDDREANFIYEYLHKSGELSEDELKNVSGGGCNDSGDTPKFKVSQNVYVNAEVGYWAPCVITWVSTTKKTTGLIFKDHQFTYNIKFTGKYRTNETVDGVMEESLDTYAHRSDAVMM